MTATALGLALFHRFNVISVAFIPLFVGMGIDLGIQFSVRYRAERRPGIDVDAALCASARTMGKSLVLAATAIAIGFLAFAPTAYYGVSQLGMIAGLGLFAALALNLTLLPALIALAQPPGAPEREPSARLSMFDRLYPGTPHPGARRRRRRGAGLCGPAAAAAFRFQSDAPAQLESGVRGDARRSDAGSGPIAEHAWRSCGRISPRPTGSRPLSGPIRRSPRSHLIELRAGRPG